MITNHANHAIQATDLIPPRTATAQMPSAPARLPATPLASVQRPEYPEFRPVETCDREYFLELAAAAKGSSWELLRSRAHVEAICAELLTVQDELLASRDTAQAHALNAEVAESLRIAALQDANDLRAANARLSAENAQFRLAAALNACALTATMTASRILEIADQLSIEELADRADRARRASNAKLVVQRARVEQAYGRPALEVFDVSDEKVVVDLGGAR